MMKVVLRKISPLNEGRVLWKVVLKGSGTNLKSKHNNLLKNHGFQESGNSWVSPRQTTALG